MIAMKLDLLAFSCCRFGKGCKHKADVYVKWTWCREYVTSKFDEAEREKEEGNQALEYVYELI